MKRLLLAIVLVGCAPKPAIIVGSSEDTDPPVVTASPAFGTYSAPQMVTLTANEPATIYVSVDLATAVPYTGALSITKTTTVSYYAVDEAGNQSIATGGAYTITTTAPDTTPPLVTATPAAGTFATAQMVTLTANEPAVILYSLDGSAPSLTYSTAIAISHSSKLRYIATDSANNASTLHDDNYLITPHYTVSPANLSTTVSPFVPRVHVAFDVAVAASGLTVSGVSGAVAYDAATHTISFTPSNMLAYDTTYNVQRSSALDTFGAGGPVSWSFTTAPMPNRVFVTSATGPADLSMWPAASGATGLIAADAICQAAGQNLGGIFRAWASDSSNDAYCRVLGFDGKKSPGTCGQLALPTGGGPWVRMDGYPFAESVEALVAGNVLTGAMFNETGGIGSLYWTGTYTSGQYATGACDDFSFAPSGPSGFIWFGNPTSTTYAWTGGSSTCTGSHALLCFEVGASHPLPEFEVPSKGAFISAFAGSGNLNAWPAAAGATGLAAADAICQSEAAAAAIPNAPSYKAWLSTSAVDARDRFTSDGPWSRQDGVMFARNKAELTSGAPFSPLNVTPTGSYLGANQDAWTGSNQFGVHRAYTCQDWASGATGDDGAFGVGFYGGNRSWFFTDSMCSNPRHLYCLED